MEGNPVIQRRLYIVAACRPDAARGQLNNGADMRHLAGPPHVARQPLPLTPDIVAPVYMRVDLKDRDRAAGKTTIGFQHRNRHRIIAAQHEWARSRIQHRRDGFTYSPAVAFGDIGCGVGGNIKVAEIRNADPRRDDAFGRHRVEQVEIMLLENRRPASRRADRRRRIMAVGTDRIGRRRPDPHDPDVDLYLIGQPGAWHVEPSTLRLAAEQVSHRHFPVHVFSPSRSRFHTTMTAMFPNRARLIGHGPVGIRKACHANPALSTIV